jgi:NADH-quinone oxidoreductase subunit F
MPKHELVLLKNMMQPGYTGSLADYEKTGGYQALRNALGKIAPTDDRHMKSGSGRAAQASTGVADFS